MVSSCLHFRFLSALPQENKIAPLLKCSLIGCQSSRRPLPEKKEKKERKKNKERKTKSQPPMVLKDNPDENQKWKRSTPQSESTPYKELKRAARTLITKKEKPCSPDHIFLSFCPAPPCCCWCLFSYPCSCCDGISMLMLMLLMVGCCSCCDQKLEQ